MLDALTAPEALPFAVALAVVAFIALLEIIGLLIGLAPSHALDNMMPDLDHGPHLPDAGDGWLASSLEWLAVGRVPVLVLIIAFLTAFGISGLVIERIAHALTGFYIPGLFASIGAFLLALPATRTIGFGLARVLPHDESDAVSMDELVGRIATVTSGTSQRGLPAEAKVTDRHGKSHYIRVEPDLDADIFATGEKALVVARHGHLFRVIRPDHSAFSET